ncbi:hypothetical protein SM124_17910 [Bacillus sp. 31A1R]|uniref:WD40-like Beta Propeller Repeat n=1 Tax=Robertmurraya mangrovi TaxID=3098077 RepID=A0ABU5J2E6_9BACI|nr:hypothetical protein [Bacillus sp. 31A1R]MDZ5473595.1 hypothetical protein [Bacillus sp. 31A1R]
MVKKKTLVILFLLLVAITIGLIVAGLFLNKTENEKLQGLSQYYDVSSKNTIAYVMYRDGIPALRLYNKDEAINAEAIKLTSEQMILDPSFSPDGSTLAFISTFKDMKSELKSSVHLLDLRTQEIRELFNVPYIVTEIEYSPIGNSLFYLQAGTFENYSPIASERPHDMDILEYDLVQENHTQITNLKKYNMNSLTIAPDAKSVYVVMDDDADAETAEEIFNTKQRVFNISFDHPENPTIASDIEREEDIFSFTFTPTGNEMIFNSISNVDSGDTFQYELYRYNVDTKEEKQLTNLESYSTDPVIGHDGKTIYFMVDQNFGKRTPQYHLYKMTMDGNGLEEITLPNIN